MSQNMFQTIGEYIETCSEIKPTEPFASEDWRELVEYIFEDEEDSEIISIKDAYVEIIPSFYEKAYANAEAKANLQDRKRRLQELIVAPQIEQRSEEWYKHAQEYLTASQFSDILSVGRTRGKLVLSKTVLPENIQRKHASWSHEMSPFDWGIRFEQVAKLMYEHVTKTKVRDIGRVVHKDKSLRLAASPDGIVEQDFTKNQERLGRLVEFKAPITRTIEPGEVPKNYWHQMQIQMEVADINCCDYFEIQLRSSKAKDSFIEGPAQHFGYVYTIGCMQPPYENPQPSRYVYSGLDLEIPDTNIPLNEGETLLETTRWELLGYNLVSVLRSPIWFETMKEPLNTFWKDVGAARTGTFILPDSKRPLRAKICLLQEDGSPI